MFLFVDDFLLTQPVDIFPVTALVIQVIQAFELLISWRKAELAREVIWIGWQFNFSTGTFFLRKDKRSKLQALMAELLRPPLR